MYKLPQAEGQVFDSGPVSKASMFPHDSPPEKRPPPPAAPSAPVQLIHPYGPPKNLQLPATLPIDVARHAAAHPQSTISFNRPCKPSRGPKDAVELSYSYPFVDAGLDPHTRPGQPRQIPPSTQLYPGANNLGEAHQTRMGNRPPYGWPERPSGAVQSMQSFMASCRRRLKAMPASAAKRGIKNAGLPPRGYKNGIAAKRVLRMTALIWSRQASELSPRPLEARAYTSALAVPRAAASQWTIGQFLTVSGSPASLPPATRICGVSTSTLSSAWSSESGDDEASDFVPTSSGPCGQRALSRLAVTCRAFMDAALDLLWRNQNSLVPLLGCLPNFWQETELGKLACTPNLTCAVTRQDWDRVLFYFKRIKKLQLSRYTAARRGASLAVMEFLSVSLPVDILLLPNIESLTWRLEPQLFTHLLLFIGPRLTEIDMELDGPASPLSLLPRVGASSPALTLVEMVDISTDSPIASREDRARPASLLILSLSDLHTVAVGPVDAPACKHLGSMPNLTSLSIDIPDGLVFLDHSPIVPPLFPSLQDLNIGGPNLPSCLNFFTGGMLNAPLTTIRVSTDTAASESQARTLFSAIGAHPSAKLITSVNVHLGDFTDVLLNNPAAYTVVPVTLIPLLHLSAAVVIRVTVPFALVLDDTFITAIANAWPQLKDLSLSRPRTINELSPSSEIRISSLAVFASNCPNLRSLELPLSAELPEPTDLRRPSQTTLTILRVLDSPINLDAPFPIASFLSATFPGLNQITTSWEYYSHRSARFGDSAETHNRWKQVEWVLPLLIAVRKADERHWRQELGA
ncbi:hypothetical protein C8R43DRAFT_1109946 [Mycena crocata]|nr:hypothetical protein C8R43DRAFT_1109946 [Mycena crocata]